MKKARADGTRKQDALLVDTMYRALDPANILMSGYQYFNKVKSLLLYPDYETVEQAIVLIKTLPILDHRDSAVFICAFLESSDETDNTAIIEFREKMGFTMDEPQHVYFWLQFMKVYFKQMSDDEQIMFLKKFETFEGFNISMICSYLKEISEMKDKSLHRVPLLLNICLTLMRFVAKLQQHYYDLERKEIEEKNEMKKEENIPKREERTEFQIEDLIDFTSSEDNKHSSIDEEDITEHEEATFSKGARKEEI